MTPADVERAGCAVAPQVLALAAGHVEGILDGIFSIGAALDRRKDAADLARAMTSRIMAVHDAVKHRPAPGVVALEWTDPLFAMGNWGPELVEAANGRLLIGEKGQHSGVIDWHEIREADPDWLIIAPCGFDLERTKREAQTLEALPGWLDLARSGKIKWLWRTATCTSTDPGPRSSRPWRSWRKSSTDTRRAKRAMPGCAIPR